MYWFFARWNWRNQREKTKELFSRHERYSISSIPYHLSKVFSNIHHLLVTNSVTGYFLNSQTPILAFANTSCVNKIIKKHIICELTYCSEQLFKNVYYGQRMTVISPRCNLAQAHSGEFAQVLRWIRPGTTFVHLNKKKLNAFVQFCFARSNTVSKSFLCLHFCSCRNKVGI